MRTAKKRVKKNDKAKFLLLDAEEMGFSEKDAAVEDLSYTGVIREYVSVGSLRDY